MRIGKSIQLIGLLVGLLAGQTSLWAQFNWRFVHPSPAAEAIYGLAATDAGFTLSGDSGLIMTSPDGLDWTRQASGTRERFEMLNFFNGRTFATGSSGAIFISDDGRTWSQQTNGGGAGPLVYGNGKYVAITASREGVVRQSFDGATWTEVTIPDWTYRELPIGLVFQGGRFWLMGNRGGLRSSADGTTWTSVTTKPADSPAAAFSVGFVAAPDKLIILRRYLSDLYAYTLGPDDAWIRLPGLDAINDLAYVNGRYLVRVGTEVRSSTDGVTWTALSNFPPSLNLASIRYWAGVWMGLDRDRRMQRSIDGENWTEVGRHRTLPNSGIVFVKDYFLMGNGLRSADGVTWTEDGFDAAAADSTGTLRGLSLNAVNGRVIATQFRRINNIEHGELWLSEDGVTGRRVAQIEKVTWIGTVLYANGRYLVEMIQNGLRKTITSTDGASWSELAPSFQPEAITRLIGADGNHFYGATNASDIYRSGDGLAWELEFAAEGRPMPRQLVAAAPGDLWVRADQGHYRRTPSDGWRFYSDQTLLAPHYSGTHWCAVANLRGSDYLDYPLLSTLAADGTWSGAPFTTVDWGWVNAVGFASGNGRTVFIAEDLIAVADTSGDLVLHRGLPLQIDGVVGTPLTLSVDVVSQTGTPLQYQWTAGGVDIEGATGAAMVVKFDDQAVVPPRFGVRVTDGVNTLNCETRYALYPQPSPVFVYDIGDQQGMSIHYSRQAADRYQVTLWAPTRGPGKTSYGWRRDGEVIADATTDRLEVEVTPSDQNHTYTVLAENDWGYSATLSRTIAGPTPIAQLDWYWFNYNEPSSRLAVNLEISAEYQETVQWRRNGVTIPGATGLRYAADPLQPSQSGFYDAVVSNPFGSFTMPTVFVPGSGSYLSNLSVRAWNGHGEKAVVPGVVVAQRSSYFPMFVRAIGPGLADFGVTGTVNDPAITLKDRDGQILATNDQWWQNEMNVGPGMAQVGAFPLGFDSLDAVGWVQGVAPVNNTSLLTAPVSSPADDEGQILVEVYRVTTSLTERLVNLSCRAEVATDKPLIAGFVVEGTGPIKLMIRAVGPALRDYGVQDVLPNPRLVLRDGAGMEIGNNDSWWQAANLADIEASRALVGGFELTPQGNDAAMYVTLEPGIYTAEIETVGGEAGVALIEIYEVP